MSNTLTADTLELYGKNSPTLSKSKTISDLLKNGSGIQLDLGGGANPQPGFINIDIRELPQVDIVHDLTDIPWPLPDGCCNRVLASHLIEHINPANFGFVNFMNEVWRICKPGAEFMIAAPYGVSPGYIQDPTHCNPVNESTFGYFDPMHKSGLWHIYKPKPWYVKRMFFDVRWSIEVLLLKHSESEEEWQKEREAWGPVNL